MEENLIQIKNSAVSLILDAKDNKELEELKIQFLGRSGILTFAIKEISRLPKEKRPEIGRLANEVKKSIEETFSTQQIKTKKETSDELKEKIDVTIPGIKPQIGHLHPLTQVLYDVIDIFKGLGYQAADGPEIETDYYN